jgi:hypothetical protein
MSNPLKAAHVYSRLGWRILPVQPGGKRPILNDWVNAATTDIATIDAWVEQFSSANVGIATGHDFFVLDVDPKNGGFETLNKLIEKYGPLPKTVEAATPSGGRHYLFKMIPGLTNSASKLGTGLDIRAKGGQIVVAPSVTSAPYRWVYAPWEQDIADSPEWIPDLLAPRQISDSTGVPQFPPAPPLVLQQAREALEKHGPAVERQGGDMHTFRAAALLVHDFALNFDEAWPLFGDWNESCEPPWSESDLRAKLNGGAKYGKRPYGCARDILAQARGMIADYRQNPSETAMLEMLDRFGKLPWEDTARKQIIERELSAITGLGISAVKLTRRRAEIVGGGRYAFDSSPTTGAPLMTLSNVVAVLESDHFEIWFDTFLQRVQTPQGEWTDKDTLKLTLDLQRAAGLNKVTTNIVAEAVATFAHRNERNCVREFLLQIEWDGVPRIEEFMIKAFGAPDTDYSRAVGGNFWRSLVVRPLKPGVKCDNMLVLEGKQGILKSTALKEIAGDWFAEASESPISKDFFLALTGALIVEIGELNAFSRADITAVKRVLSCQSDRFRAPYERTSTDHPRQGIFVGTTNADDWARDPTGARRFWPIRCAFVDIDYIRTHRTQLFAEAVASVGAGNDWWSVPASATEEQEQRRAVDPWETILSEYLKSGDEVRTVDLLTNPLGIESARMTRGDESRVAECLKRLGFKRMIKRDGTRRDVVWTTAS